jgi:hypothetical protein
MVRKFIIAIAATAALGAALSPTGALAARWGGGHWGGFSGPHFSQGWGRGDIRADRRDLRADRFDIRRDRRDLARDRQDVRRDLRFGTSADIARDRADIRRDRADIRADRFDIRRDRRDLFRDRHGF